MQDGKPLPADLQTGVWPSALYLEGSWTSLRLGLDNICHHSLRVFREKF